MFYHSRELKYVEYGRVRGVEEGVEGWIKPSYKWLEHYCGYYPQIWLSRSKSRITGIEVNNKNVMFGFSVIKGFNLDYSNWHFVLSALKEGDEGFDLLEERVKEYVEDFIKLDIEYKEKHGEERITLSDDYEGWRDNELFLENDQVVVPSLNLKSAKIVVCRNEKVKRKLRRMGFIEDRIEIRNFK